MQKQEIEAYLDRLVTVELDSGPHLTGTLRRSNRDVLLAFEVVQSDGTHAVFSWTDVIAAFRSLPQGVVRRPNG
jgi:hypothetical protein